MINRILAIAVLVLIGLVATPASAATAISYSEPDNAYIEYTSDGTGTPTGQTISADGLTLDSFDHGFGLLRSSLKTGLAVSNTSFNPGTFSSSSSVNGHPIPP